MFPVAQRWLDVVPTKVVVTIAVILSPFVVFVPFLHIVRAHQAALMGNGRRTLATRFSGVEAASRVAVGACALSAAAMVMSASIARGAFGELSRRLEVLPDVMVTGPGAVSAFQGSSGFVRVVPMQVGKVLVAERVLDVAVIDDGEAVIPWVKWPKQPTLLIDADLADELDQPSGEVEVSLGPMSGSTKVTVLVTERSLGGRVLLQARGVRLAYGFDAAAGWMAHPRDGACALLLLHGGVGCLGREELERDTRAMRRLAELVVLLLLGFLLQLTAWLVAVSVVSLALERRTQLATLRALGASAGALRGWLLQWAGGLALRGGVAGIVGAASWALLFAAWPPRLDPRIFFIDTLRVELSPIDAGIVIGCLVVTAVASALWPAHQASRRSVIEALRL